MAPNPSNSSNLDQLVLKGLRLSLNWEGHTTIDRKYSDIGYIGL